MTSDVKSSRRRRADSKEAAVQDMLNSERVITPPADTFLTNNEHLLFAELPRGEWTQHMIRLAADLARTMADARDETDAIRREGSVVTGAAGGPIRNPRCAQLASLQATITSMRRSLAIHSRAKGGMDTQGLARRRDIQRANEAFPLDDDENLLARPDPTAPFGRAN